MAEMEEAALAQLQAMRSENLKRENEAAQFFMKFHEANLATYQKHIEEAGLTYKPTVVEASNIPTPTQISKEQQSIRKKPQGKQ